MTNNKFVAILAIVNQGFSDNVMEAAREHGARGGTVINARGTAKAEAESKYNIVIHPEKEIIIILAKEEIKDNILHAIYKEVGLNTPGQGIAFALPVDEVVGIAGKKVVKEIKKEAKIDEEGNK